MSEIFFYHITRTPLELTLGELLEKTMARGWRALVRSCSEEMLLRLDAQLWLRGDTGFMAHGLAGGAHDADQPILLSSQAGNPNRADILFALGNTPIDPGEVQRFERVCLLFDGNDPENLSSARDQWRALGKTDHVTRYWSQESGNWREKS